MTITPAATAATATAAAATSGGTGVTAANFTSNFDTFLTLLTTELQNQDPLSPMDTDQFTQQLATFSEVEQQIQTNSNLSTLISNQSASQVVSALPLVGNTIQYTGNQAALENGQAAFSYTLPSNAASASISIEDANGNTVFSTTANTSAGTYPFVWNGQTNGGQQLPDGGLYTINVLAANANNTPITATTTASGIVTGVSVNNNVATFNVSGVSVPMGQLLSINPSSSSTASN
jgi:flagellar basal-body rod modification protein FlgD